MTENDQELVLLKRYTVPRGRPWTGLIALPKIWVDDVQVQAGDVIEILRAPGSKDLTLRKVEKRRVEKQYDR